MVYMCSNSIVHDNKRNYGNMDINFEVKILENSVYCVNLTIVPPVVTYYAYRNYLEQFYSAVLKFIHNNSKKLIPVVKTQNVFLRSPRSKVGYLCAFQNWIR